MNKYEDIFKDVPYLNKLSDNDIQQALLIDTSWVLCNAMRDYLKRYGHAAGNPFVQEIKTFWEQFSQFHNKLYLNQNSYIQNMNGKDRSLLQYLIRDNIAKQAFHEHLENVYTF